MGLSTPFRSFLIVLFAKWFTQSILSTLCCFATCDSLFKMDVWWTNVCVLAVIRFPCQVEHIVKWFLSDKCTHCTYLTNQHPRGNVSWRFMFSDDGFSTQALLASITSSKVSIKPLHIDCTIYQDLNSWYQLIKRKLSRNTMHGKRVLNFDQERNFPP